MAEKEEALGEEEVAQIKVELKEIKEILEGNLFKMQKINKVLTEMEDRIALAIKEMKEMLAQKKPIDELLAELAKRGGSYSAPKRLF